MVSLRSAISPTPLEAACYTKKPTTFERTNQNNQKNKENKRNLYLPPVPPSDSSTFPLTRRPGEKDQLARASTNKEKETNAKTKKKKKKESCPFRYQTSALVDWIISFTDAWRLTRNRGTPAAQPVQVRLGKERRGDPPFIRSSYRLFTERKKKERRERGKGGVKWFVPEEGSLTPTDLLRLRAN